MRDVTFLIIHLLTTVANHLPQPFHHITPVESSGPSGVTGVSTPPMGPYFFPQSATYLPANSEGVSYSARSGLLVPTKYPVHVDFIDISDRWQVALPV